MKRGEVGMMVEHGGAGCWMHDLFVYCCSLREHLLRFMLFNVPKDDMC